MTALTAPAALSTENRDAVVRAARLADGVPAADLPAVLYARWYAPAGSVPPAVGDDAPLTGSYRVAHAAGALPWLPARVVHRGMAGVVVVREAATDTLRAVVRGDYAHVGRDAAEVVVTPVRGGVVSEGWWRTWSAGWNPTAPGDAVSRVYLAPAAGAAAAIFRAVTGVVVPRPAPWLLKAAADRTILGRPDAVVLYVPDEALTGPLLDALAGATDGLRRATTPAFTEPVAPGLAWAHGPAGDESFGELICRVVAGALATGPADPVDAVEQALVAAGLDPARPHLRSAS